MKNEGKIDRNSVISASEIGQYCYCSIAWYLQKRGFKPDSEMLETGQKRHDELGQLINKTERKMVKSRILAVIGYIVLFFSILIIIFEVLS
jgi:ATP/ADP translocase